jgi:hypothetical protein
MVVGLLGAATSLPSAGAPAAAQSDEHGVSAVSALATADALRTTVTGRNAPASDVPLDLGGANAQAVTDSLGTSQAFASHPYPGDHAITGPGLIAGVTNGAVNIPAYPFYVNANYPTIEEQTLETGIHTLTAEAEERSARGEVRSESGPAGEDFVVGHLRAAAGTTIEASGAAISSAVTGIRGLAVGPLRITEITASATVERRANGTVERSSALALQGASVAGIPVEVTGGGLQAGEGTVPADPGGGDTINETLAAQGITVRYLASRESERAVVSPALEITVTRPIDGPVTSVTYTVVVGRAIAAVEGAGAVAPPVIEPGTEAVPAGSPEEPRTAGSPVPPDPGDDGPAAGRSPAVPPASSAPGPDPVAVISGEGTAGAPPTSRPLPPPASTIPDGGEAPARAGDDLDAALAVTGRSTDRLELRASYVLLFVAGLALVILTPTMGRAGLRLRQEVQR